MVSRCKFIVKVNLMNYEASKAKQSLLYARRGIVGYTLPLNKWDFVREHLLRRDIVEDKCCCIVSVYYRTFSLSD